MLIKEENKNTKNTGSLLNLLGTIIKNVIKRMKI